MKMQIVSQAVRAGRKYMQENPEKVQKLAHSAGDFVNKRTSGKYADKIMKAEAAADKYIAKQRTTQVPPASTPSQQQVPGNSAQTPPA